MCYSGKRAIRSFLCKVPCCSTSWYSFGDAKLPSLHRASFKLFIYCYSGNSAPNVSFLCPFCWQLFLVLTTAKTHIEFLKSEITHAVCYPAAYILAKTHCDFLEAQQTVHYLPHIKKKTEKPILWILHCSNSCLYWLVLCSFAGALLCLLMCYHHKLFFSTLT